MIKREKKERVRLGIIGLGRRGSGMLRVVFGDMADVDIIWLCDLVPEKLDKAAKVLKDKGKELFKTTADYKDILNDESVDAVAICTDWRSHVPLALEFLNAKKYTAIEVGGAYDLYDCYALIEAYERNQAPLMMLENACYVRRELMALRMVKEGIFGEIVHCDGGYMHYLPDMELFKPAEDGSTDISHYRVYDYQKRNCEQYPTHEFGPIAKVLGINRGNRVLSLSSFASKSRCISQYMKDHVEKEHPLYGKTFAQGDIITTVLTCAGGETVRLTLDTTAPRPFYSRNFTVRGTLGCCMEEGGHGTFYLEGMPEPVKNNEQEFYEKYEHPLYTEYNKITSRGGHGGVDWLVGRAFIESVKAGTDTPIDAYDTATWMAITPLSEASIAKGGAPVEFPDFTRGRWLCREEPVKSKYSLDEIIIDPDTPIVPEE